jgi:hypothetical protein
LLVLAMVESESETILGLNGLVFGAIIILSGCLLYLATRKVMRLAPEPAPSQVAAD